MRGLSTDEYDFLCKTEILSGQSLHAVGLTRECYVSDMNDGGMGSIKFEDLTECEGRRKLGKQLVQGEFNDADGTLVSFSINTDTNERLFELDLWRVDFQPLKRLPSALSDIRIYAN